MRRWLLPLAILAGEVLYTLFCLTVGFMPRCPFKWITGWDCPGCGSQRAARAFLSGDFGTAWEYNRLLPFVVAYLAAITLLPALPGDRPRRIYNVLTSATAIWIILAAVVTWWILRNIIGI